jgi:carbamate kinase
MKTIVIALGGNALGNSPQEQMEIVKTTAVSVVDLVEQGNKVIVAHGNGPQVGMIQLAFDDAKKVNEEVVQMPLSSAGAMTQGYIGHHLQLAIQNELNKRSIKINTAAIITQTLVDQNDSSFADPTKPIGSFYSEEVAKELAAVNG